MNRLSRRAFNVGLKRQKRSITLADQSADDIESIIVRYVRGLARIMQGKIHPAHAVQVSREAEHLFGNLLADLVRTIAQHTEKAIEITHESTANFLSQLLPLHESRIREADWLKAIYAKFATAQFNDLFDTNLPDLDPVEVVKSLVFPAPSAHEVNATIFNTGWVERLQAQTRLASPQAIGQSLFQAFTQGESIKEIGKRLEPVVAGVRATAKRIARHEVMWASHRTEQNVWSHVDDLIIGYQVHGVLDDRIRPEHKKRAGTIYYKNPKGNQKGLDKRPNPPYEADGSIAYNCRCFLTPIFQPKIQSLIAA